ncbi:ribosome maturation factor RimP [Desulfuromonas carbonis]|uniref:ribosome maturation factor RimP n=1 Tax=Desulfuromonas sp. DDH964 TaxID=1823759 RepID=UPI00078CCFDC|nr:ribosome maturation factor RimP [Desulfuromonas sp. DDH964]AMV72077.1 ribosome maturation factor [Desulfuromonas sp. DDH964]
MTQASLLENIQRLLAPILAELGLEGVDLEYLREGRDLVLRIFIDKPGGVTLDDCAEVSREFGAILEIENLIPGAYRLEVSSPGIDRALKKPEDFRRFAGERVKLKTLEQLDPDGRGQPRKTFGGRLLGLDGEMVRVLQLDKKGGEVVIPLDAIVKANLDPEF